MSDAQHVASDAGLNGNGSHNTFDTDPDGPAPFVEAEPPPLRRRRSTWSPISTLLIRSSGADRELLRRAEWKWPYDNRFEVPYFVGLGGAIVATACLGGLSATFAASMAFAGGDHPLRYWPLGLIFGLVLFNIDRWLVSDSDVGYEPTNLGSWLGNFISEVLKLLPRLAISLVLGFLFAEPLLLQFFHVDVDNQIHHTYRDDVTDLAKSQTDTLSTSFADAKNGLKGLVVQRSAVDPEIRAQISAQARIVQSREERLLFSNYPRSILEKDQARLDRDRAAFTRLHAAEFRRYRSELTNLAAIESLSSAQISQLASYECPYPGSGQGSTPETPGYPVGVPKHMSLGLTCPEKPDGAIDKLDAIGALGNSKAAGTSASRVSSTGAGHVNAAIWLLRSAMIGLDILPVTVKFVRGILPKKGYYLSVVARQKQTDYAAKDISDYARSRYNSSVRRRETLQGVEEEVLNLEREKIMHSASDLRIRAGLSWLYGRGQALLRRDRAANSDTTRPPARDTGEPEAPRPDSSKRTEYPDPEEDDSEDDMYGD